jgi:hypothetical protein
MDEKYYSPKTVNTFIKDVICLGKDDMKKAWENDDPIKWRKLLARHNVKNDTVTKMITVAFTDIARMHIHAIISKMTRNLLPLGELIVGGGEAFNFYSPRDHRIVTSDIDTKFVPGFKFGEQTSFLKLQCVRLLLWDQLEVVRRKFNKNIKADIIKLSKTKLGKFLNISHVEKISPITRRYTMKPKTRQNFKLKTATAGNTLADTEIFALDVNLKWYHPEQKRSLDSHVGGMLDIVLLKRDEMGSDIWDDRKYVAPSKVYVAGKKYLVEDLYLLNKLGLRKEKADKDRKRLYIFSKYILNIPKVYASMSTDKLYKHVKPYINKIKFTPRYRKKFNMKLAYTNAMKVNPLRSEKGISRPKVGKSRQMALSIRGPRGLKINGYNETSGNFKFNTRKLVWTRNKKLGYIHDEIYS